MHFDPEFETFTYGDPTAKRTYLLRLERGDLLAFYAGLAPFRTDAFPRGLYLIGCFTVDHVLNLNQLSDEETGDLRRRYPNNAHVKRSVWPDEGLVIVVGQPGRSRLLGKAIPLSEPKLDRRGRPYHAVSREMEPLLGVSGSIQRSVPPRLVTGGEHLASLARLLGLG